MKDILTTMITPYKKDGSVDYETALKYVDWYFENGLNGIFAVCQSSEIFYQTLRDIPTGLAIITIAEKDNMIVVVPGRMHM